MFYFRTDANENIATGHIMRCMTIAYELQKKKQNVRFIIIDPESEGFVNGKFEYIKVSRDNEESDIQTILKEEKNPVLFLDNYKYDSSFMGRMRKCARVVTFDDLYLEKLDVDMLINYNIYASQYDYASRYNDSSLKLLLGSEYVPLREEFRSFDLKKERNGILLICGGGDMYNILLDILYHLCESKINQRERIIVIAGALNSHYEELKQVSLCHQNIEIYRNVDNLSYYLSSVNMVVSAASTVLYECCATLTPTIFFVLADNQMMDAEEFAKDNMMCYVGDIRVDRKRVVDKICREIQKLDKDEARKTSMREKMQEIVDGLGAIRIADELLQMCEYR